MTENELTARHPIAWHMAEDGSWPGIEAHGLLSTSALLDLYQISGALRRQLLSERRPRSVTIRRDGFNDAVVRDQKPMTDAALLKCLQDGMTPSEWYDTLNRKTFFWVSRERLDRLLQARAYRNKAQVILTVDTASLIAANQGRVMLSSINSGATLYVPQPRGLKTFLSIDQFQHDATLARKSGSDAVVELVVEAGVPDVRDHVLRVERVAAGVSTTLWRR
ncbi:MAG: DUF7002 family protein [Acidiphilium sp.]